MASLLGIDFGTGGAKVCLMDSGGKVLGYAFEELELIHRYPDWSEHRASEYWPVVCRLVRHILKSSPVQPDDIKGIAVSSALPSMVMVDEHNQPIANAYNLMDKRARDQVQWLKNEIGEDRIFRLSGYRLEDHPVLVNVLWEKQHRADSYSSIAKILTIDGYVALKLTGVATVHYSAAAFYGVAYNMRQREFDEVLLDELEIDADVLPTLFNCDDIIGEVTQEAASDCGLVPGIPVAAGQVDCNAAWLGAGAIKVGDFQSNLGTVGNFGIIHKNLDYMFSDIGRLMINFPYTVDSKHTFVTAPTTLTGGQCMRWIRDQLAQHELFLESNGGKSVYDQLNVIAAPIPPGSEGLITLPFFMGERTPLWDADARAVLFGLTLSHTKGHIVRSMMEGVAFALYDSFRLIQEADLKINYPMVLNEGGAVSRLWRQIISDVFNVPIVLVKNRVGAPYGDAILAGVATGLLPDYSVAKAWSKTIEPIEPNEVNHKIYQEYYQLFKTIYNHLKTDFRSLRELRDR